MATEDVLDGEMLALERRDFSGKVFLLFIAISLLSIGISNEEKEEETAQAGSPRG